MKHEKQYIVIRPPVTGALRAALPTNLFSPWWIVRRDQLADPLRFRYRELPAAPLETAALDTGRLDLHGTAATPHRWFSLMPYQPNNPVYRWFDFY